MITDLQRQNLVEQFHLKHGGDSVQVDDWILYADGAKRDRNRMGPLFEPPDDAYQRGKLVVQYWEVRLRRATAAFDELKGELIARANEAIRHAAANTPPPPPGEDELAQLRELKAAVEQCQTALEAARTQLDANRPAGLRSREERAAANRDRNLAALEAVREIKI